jgi:hypothetical protein
VLSLTMLPARQGDAIWIRWGDPGAPHQMLVDMGTEETGRQVSSRIRALPEPERVFDLLVVTHADCDHVGGVLTCLADDDAAPILGLDLGDVWFNGWPHLSGGIVSTGLKPMGPPEGERLASWLKDQRWNSAFGGRAVAHVPGQPPKKAPPFYDDLTLTVLGPTPERLTELRPVWKRAVEDALRKRTLAEASEGLAPMGPKAPPILKDDEDLHELADQHDDPDASETNGSSIALLVEYHDRRVLLAGDAFAPDLVAGIEAVSPGKRLHLDAFKVPHHCSQNNVSTALVEAVECERWLISTDGTLFRHPDPPAVARILRSSSVRPTRLMFNVPSTYNGWWNNRAWEGLFDYQTSYGTAGEGLTVTLE